ncbi:unnamed protein product [Rangifer tarandus platyrhynchus]|uniref:Uncharacterized protein n=2 Tax=Rangifer tarandus platyrhynchus TaxID=3082113 RepID=A0ABN8ZYY1_RANTA|nr:unnamed protein product [Rangifer tarandus platyrhynchus]
MDWTLAMALEAGVWGKAGWLALHSHSEGLLTLASVPQHLPSLPPEVLHSVCGVPSFWLSSCLCVSLSTSGCVCVCVPAHACMCLFLLPPSGSGCHFWLSALSPATSVPQPEREEMLSDAPTSGLQGHSCPVCEVSLPPPSFHRVRL